MLIEEKKDFFPLFLHRWLPLGYEQFLFSEKYFFETFWQHAALEDFKTFFWIYLFLVGSFPTYLPWWDCTFKLDFRVYFWDWNHQLLCVMLLCSILRGKNSSLLLTRSLPKLLDPPLFICKGWTPTDLPIHEMRLQKYLEIESLAWKRVHFSFLLLLVPIISHHISLSLISNSELIVMML